MQAGIPGKILAQELNSRVFALAAHDAGYIADDAAAAKQVKTMLAPLVKDGVTEKEPLNRFLTSSGMSEDALVSTLKSQIATDSLLQIVAGGARAPQEMVNDALKYK